MQIAPSYRSPYTQQIGASIERQLTKTTTLTVTYLHSFGVHQLVTRDSNAYLPGTYQYGSATLTGVRPNSTLGIVNQFFPEAVFKQNQVIVNVNARIKPKFSVFGFYNLTNANTDGGAGSTFPTPTTSARITGARLLHRTNMVFMMANYTGPWAIRFNPFLIAQSGRPYNIVTDERSDRRQLLQQRPRLWTAPCAPASPHATHPHPSVASTQTPADNYTPIGMNLGNGPAAVARESASEPLLWNWTED